MANGDTTSPATQPGSTTTSAAPSPPKPTPADLRKSADQMREMAKWSAQRGSEARAKESDLERQAAAQERQTFDEYNRSLEVGREIAQARAAKEHYEGRASQLEGYAKDDREKAAKLDAEADKIQASDPVKAADLREEANVARQHAGNFDAQVREAREQLPRLENEMRVLKERQDVIHERSQEHARKEKDLRAEAEKAEQAAEEHEAIARSQEMQAEALDDDATTLEVGDAALDGSEPQSLLDEQTDAAREVLGTVAPEDLSPDDALARIDAADEGGTAVGDAGAEEIPGEEPLVGTMAADEPATASQDDAMLGSDLETGETEPPGPAEAPLNETSDLEV